MEGEGGGSCNYITWTVFGGHVISHNTWLCSIMLW